MAKYVIISTDSNRETVVVGRTDSKDEAQIIMRDDFVKWFLEKINKEDVASFEEAYAALEGKECKLSKDHAWLNNCNHIDMDWNIIDTTTVDILSEPLSMHQMILVTSDENTYVQGNIIIELDEVIGYGLEEFLDLIADRLVGNPCLMDVNYKPIDVMEDGRLIIRASGDVSEILELDDEMVESLKRIVFDKGINAIEDLLDCELQFETDETLSEAMDDVLDQMPDEEQIKYYRKYVK